jgi:dolichol kinase
MQLDLETKRQAVHFLSGTGIAGIVYALPSLWALAFLAGSGLVTFVFRHLILNGHHVPLFSRLVEHTERPGKPPGSGVTWFFLGNTLAFVVFTLVAGVPKEFVVAAMLVLSIGDSVCVAIGRAVGKKRLPMTRTKTWWGSLTGFGAAFFGASFVLNLVLPAGQAVIVAFAGALAGMLTEAYLRSVDDNFSIPVMACSAMIIAFSLLRLV